MSLKEVNSKWKIIGFSILAVIVLLAVIKAVVIVIKVVTFILGVALFAIPVAIVYGIYALYKKY